jgi:hypothetical protein
MAVSLWYYCCWLSPDLTVQACVARPAHVVLPFCRMEHDNLIACHECDTLFQKPHLTGRRDTA